VFSGDLDKAIAAFIIANGAASMGKKVTMFFTFWGLSVIKKREKVNVNKSLIEKMFGMMLPHDSFGLGAYSCFDFAGIDIMGEWIHIYKDRHCSKLKYRVYSCGKASSNANNFVALSNGSCAQS
jgi:hypothetical protein